MKRLRYCFGALLSPTLLYLAVFQLVLSVAYYSYASNEMEPSGRVTLIPYSIWLTWLGWYVQRRARITGCSLNCCCFFFFLCIWPISVPVFFFRSERWRNAALRTLAIYLFVLMPVASAMSGAYAAEQRRSAATDENDDGYCAGEWDDESDQGHAAGGESFEMDDDEGGLPDDEQQAEPDDEDEEAPDDTAAIPV